MKLIAKTKDGDIFEVKLQRMFPNCGKRTKCCDETWTKDSERSIKIKPKWEDYTLLTEKDKKKEPEEFKGW